MQSTHNKFDITCHLFGILSFLENRVNLLAYDLQHKLVPRITKMATYFLSISLICQTPAILPYSAIFSTLHKQKLSYKKNENTCEENPTITAYTFSRTWFISCGNKYSSTPDLVYRCFTCTHMTKSHIYGDTFRTFISFSLRNIFRGHDLISCSNGIILCAYEIAFHANDLLNRSYDLLICAHNLIFWRNDLVKRSQEIFIHANDTTISGWYYKIQCTEESMDSMLTF